MTRPRFLLDENLPPRLQQAVKRRAAEMVVRRVGAPDAPPFQADDPSILSWCDEHYFILVTNNRRSMPVHLRAHLDAGQHVPGILVALDTLPLRQIVDELVLIWGASEMEEYRDLRVFINAVGHYPYLYGLAC